MEIIIWKSQGNKGSCMHCKSNENVYMFMLGSFEARLCLRCLLLLRKSITSVVIDMLGE